jgi:hypothetical protein
VLTSWNPLGHSRPVKGLLYLYLLHTSQCSILKNDHSPQRCPKKEPTLRKYNNTDSGFEALKVSEYNQAFSGNQPCKNEFGVHV